MARVLVADDESSIRGVIVATCELDAHDVRAYGRWEDAIAAYEEFAPDLLILDVRMPGGGAVKILTGIESASGKRACPAIVVTGDVYDEAGDLPQHPAIVEILKKPFGIDALRIAVKTALSRGGLDSV